MSMLIQYTCCRSSSIIAASKTTAPPVKPALPVAKSSTSVAGAKLSSASDSKSTHGHAHHASEYKKRVLRKVQSVVRKDSFILQQPVSIEAPIPEDLEQSISKKSFKVSGFVKSITTKYMRSNRTRIILLSAAVISCVVYVVETYLSRDSSPSFFWFAICVDVGTFIIFGLDYLFNISYAATKMAYILSFQGLVDFASLLSIVNLFVTNADLSFLPLFRLTRVLKVLRLFRTASIVNVERPTPPSASEAILFEIISLVISIFLAIFLAASILYTIIQQDSDAFVYNTDHNFVMNEDITFFDCIYIVLVLVTTLGFGDFTPNNQTGRAFVVVVLVITLTIIPYKAGQLADTVAKKPRYMNEVNIIPCDSGAVKYY
jgi:voltage-gated potassium channel